MPSKGIKTTEFAMMIIVYLTMIANGTTFINIPWDILMGMIASTVGYGAMRTVEKAVAHNSRKPDGNPLTLTNPVPPPPPVGTTPKPSNG